MRFFSAVALVVLISCALTSCRKGPEDPLLSFTTRKNRISKTWNAYSYRINSVEQLIKVQQDVTAAGDCGTRTVVKGDSMSIQMTFSKTGTYADNFSTVRIDRSSTSLNPGGTCNDLNYNNRVVEEKISQGVWNFSGGVGNTSSREQVFIYQEETQTGYLWDIIRLASDELKLKRKYIKQGESVFTTEEIFFYPL